MDNRSKVVFKVPDAMQQELRRQVIEDGYGMRGKSKWVSEAIERLLSNNSYAEYVNLGEDMKKVDKIETVVVEPHIKELIDKAILEIRKKHPLLEGVRSCLVRTSIIQRLLRS